MRAETLNWQHVYQEDMAAAPGRRAEVEAVSAVGEVDVVLGSDVIYVSAERNERASSCLLFFSVCRCFLPKRLPRKLCFLHRNGTNNRTNQRIDESTNHPPT